MDINSSNYRFETVPLQQFFRRQSDNLNDSRYRNLTDNLHDILTGYNNTMRIYNENMSRFLLLSDEYRRDIRMIQTQTNINQHLNTNNRYTSNRHDPNITSINGRRSTPIGVTQSSTFTRPIGLYSNIFSNLASTYEDVIVRPSQTQINNALETVVYSNELSLMNSRCPITMEDFIVGERISVIRHCRHSFLEHAIQSWFQTNVRCPVCRYDIRESSSDTHDISHNTIDSSGNFGINNNTINQLTLQISNMLAEAMGTQPITDISQNSYFLFDIPITVTRRIDEHDDDDDDDDDDDIEDVEGIE